MARKKRETCGDMDTDYESLVKRVGDLELVVRKLDKRMGRIERSRPRPKQAGIAPR